MTSYNGQEDLDPLISALVRNNKLETTGDRELDLLALEEVGALVIAPAVGHLALRSKELVDVK
jgi:hypothetical protein